LRRALEHDEAGQDEALREICVVKGDLGPFRGFGGRRLIKREEESKRCKTSYVWYCGKAAIKKDPGGGGWSRRTRVRDLGMEGLEHCRAQ